MLGVGGAEKCALMMIEPPGELVAGGVLEVDDGVDFAVKHGFVPGLGRGVHHACVEELGAGIVSGLGEPGEECGRGGTVEAVIVVEHSDPHGKADGENPLGCTKSGANASALGLSGNNRVISTWRTHSCVPRRHSCRRLASSTRTGVEMRL